MSILERQPKWRGIRYSLKRYTAGALVSALLLGMVLPFGSAADINVSQVSAAQEGEKPRIIIESNAVIDDFGDLTGYLEVALHVKTPVMDDDEHKTFRYLGVSLEYNSDILTPVDWTAPDGVTTKDVDLSSTTPGSYKDQVKFQTLKCNDSTTAIAHVSGPSGEGGEVHTGLFYIVSEASKSVDFSEDTVVAVVRFRYDKSTYQPWENAPDQWTDAKNSDTWLVRFAPDAVSGLAPDSSFVTQQLLYQSGDNAFYYTEDPATTAGKRVEAVDAPTGQEYLTNLLTMGNVQAENDRDVRFTLRNLPTYDAAMRSNFATILYYDYTDRLMGVQTVLPGDARVAVNTFVERNFIHPKLRASAHKGDPNYTDSIEREYSYRGIYPSTDPENGETVPDGEKYKLTYKLDYTFYKRYTTSEVIDPDGIPNSGDEVTQWTTTPVSEVTDRSDPANPTSAYLKDLPYINGWAVINDLDDIENVWTTFGTGELGNCDPASGSFTTTGESSYFRFADFSRLTNGQVIYVKACYEPGTLLVPNDNYATLSEAAYVRYGTDTTTVGGVYAVSFTYGRVNLDGYGVSRTRQPAVRLMYTPDIDGVGQTPFAVEVPVENLDIIEVEYTPSSAIMSMEYNLSDKKPYNSVFGTTRAYNFFAASVRSKPGNELDILENFNYQEFPIPDHLGSKGFVTQATLNQILQYGTEAVLTNNRDDFDGIMNLGTVQDMNWRTNTSGAGVTAVTLSRVRQIVYDAIKVAVGQNMVDEKGNANLGWHQIQYHLVNANFVNVSTPITSGGLHDGIPGENTLAFSWCHMDDCAGSSVPITDVTSLLQATYDSVANGNPNAFNQLMSSFGFRTGIKGVPFTGLNDFRDAIIKVVRDLHGASVPQADIEGMSWRQVQYLLDKGGSSIPSAAVAAAEDYWWENNGTKSFTSLSELLTTFYNVKYDGYHTSWTGTIKAAELNTFLLRKDTSGAEYKAEDVDAFRTAMDTIIQTLQLNGYTGGTITDGTLGDAEKDTALVLQHLLLAGEYKTPAELKAMTDSGAISYWWITGAPVPTDYSALLEMAWRVYDTKDVPASFLDEVTVELVTKGDSGDFWLRGGEKGQPFADDAALKAALETAMTKLREAVNAGKLADPPTGISWGEFQHVLLGNDYESDPNPDPNPNPHPDLSNQKYWWHGGTHKPITDLPSLLEAAWNSYGGGDGNPPKDSADKDAIDKGLAAITDAKTFINGIEGAANYEDYLYLRADTNGGEFELKDFKTALSSAINRDYGRGRELVGKTTWIELQYMLLGGTYRREALLRNDSSIQYWWENGKGKPSEDAGTILENLNILLLKILDGAVDPSDLEAVLTDEALGKLKFQDSNGDGYSAERLAYLLSDLDDEVGMLYAFAVLLDEDEDAASAYLDDDGNLVFTWAEIQYFLLNGELETDDNIDHTVPPYDSDPTASTYRLRRNAPRRPVVEETTEITVSEDGLTETIEHTVLTRRTDGSWTSVVTTTVVTTTETVVVTVTTAVTTEYDPAEDKMTTETDTNTEVTMLTSEETPEEELKDPEEDPEGETPEENPQESEEKPENPEENPQESEEPENPEENPEKDPEENPEENPEKDPDKKPEGSEETEPPAAEPTDPPEPEEPQEPNVEPEETPEETSDETPAETPEPPGPEPEGTDQTEGGELAMARLLRTDQVNTGGLRGLLYGTILRLSGNTGQPGVPDGITQGDLIGRGEAA